MYIKAPFVKECTSLFDYSDRLTTFPQFEKEKGIKAAALHVAETTIADVICAVCADRVGVAFCKRTLVDAWGLLISSNCPMIVPPETECQLSDAVDMLPYLYSHPEEITEDAVSLFTILGRQLLSELSQPAAVASIA